VPQEPPFALDLTIEENFYLENPIMKNHFVMDRKAMQEKVKRALKAFGLDIAPTTPVHKISMEDRHIIYTALVTELYDGDIILLDEVTSALRKAQTDKLFEYLNIIKKDKAIVLITHRIPEVINLCDTVTVFRDGKKITTDSVKNLDAQSLSDLIVGESVEKPSFAEKYYCQEFDGDKIFSVNDLSLSPYFRDISFSLNAGEILGITGLIESGTSQLFRASTGILKTESGDIFVKGKKVEKVNPGVMISKSVVYGTNDRIREGSFNELSILKNINAGIWDRLVRSLVLNETAEYNTYSKFKDEYNIKSTDPKHGILTLSGGNQQKVILGRLAATEPQILFLDEPTKGIDVGAKYEILKLLRMNIVNDKTTKKGIVMNSSSIEELMLVCDRVLVMVNGSLVREFTRNEFSERKIFRAIQGV
jgi:ABC-type sugar transport system ATPase subunit